MIADAMDKVGKDGVITVEESQTADMSVKTVEGMQFDKGYVSPHFATEQDTLECILTAPRILLYDGKIQSTERLLPILEALAQTGGILALSTVEDPENYDTYFLMIDRAKFKNKVVPGDTLILKMELLSPIRRGICEMKGTAS